MQSKEQILITTAKISRLQEQLNTLDKEIQALQDFNGVGHLGVGLMGGAVGHISFGQLLERYQDTLQEPLVKLKKLERSNVDAALTAAIAELSICFQVEKKLWYPDTPGWTWHERDPSSKRPQELTDYTPVVVLTNWDRDGSQAWYGPCARVASYWDWSGGTIVAYALED